MGQFWRIIDFGLTGSYILQSYAIRIPITYVAKLIANYIVHFTIIIIAILLNYIDCMAII